MAEDVMQADISTEERELGTQPIPKLFTKYTFTTMLGMAAQAIMVIIEGFIIGKYLGGYGLAITGLLMPLEYVNLGLGGAFGMGVSSIAGGRLGVGDTEGAKKAFSQGFWLSLIISTLLGVAFFIFADPIATMLGATPDLKGGLVTALRIFVCWYPFSMVGQMLTSALRIEEKPGLSSAIMTGSAIVAALWLWFSVAIAQLGVIGTSMYYGASIGLWSVALFYFLGKSATLRIALRDIAIDVKLAASMLKVGFPTLVLQLATVLYTVVINNMLNAAGAGMAELQIAAFSLINGYSVYVINMVWQSCQYGVQPIASYNFGAKAYGRMRELLKSTVAITVLAVFAVSAAAIVFATPICQFFGGGDEQLVAIAAKNTLPVAAFICVGCLGNVVSTYFQSIERVNTSIVLGLSRYVFFAAPLMFAFSQFMGVQGVWIALPVADLCTFAFTMVFVVREYRRLGALASSQE